MFQCALLATLETRATVRRVQTDNGQRDVRTAVFYVDPTLPREVQEMEHRKQIAVRF